METSPQPLPAKSNGLQALRLWLASPDARWLTVPLLAFLLTRLVVFAAAYSTDYLVGDNLPDYARANADQGLLSAWYRWDTEWYIRLVDEGYSYTPGQKSTIHFFPLYPLLMMAVRPLVGGNAMVAGLLLSNVLFLAALILLYRLVILLLNNQVVARNTVFYIAAFPTAFFFSAVYRESLHLLLFVGAAYFALQRRWLLASLCVGLGSALRLPGVLIGILVIYEWLSAQGWTLDKIHHSQAWTNLRQGIRSNYRLLFLMAILMPSGLLAYMLYLQIQFGNPLLFRSPTNDFLSGVNVLQEIQWELNGQIRPHVLPYYTFVDLASFVFALVLVIPLWRVRQSYAVYTLVHSLLTMTSSSLGTTRYVVVLFPVFIVLGIWGRNKTVDRILKIIFLPLLGLFTALFVMWVMVG